MPRSNNSTTRVTPRAVGTALTPRRERTLTPTEEASVHVLKAGFVCDTESRGHATPGGRGLAEIVLDASAGFIPLWAEQTTLRWRFRERSFAHLTDAAGAKAEIRRILAAALLEWGAAAPVRFTEDDDLWDFEIVMRSVDQCTNAGCVLASAFFPDGGRHELTLYPILFEQSPEEQLDTMLHEIGHVFGLRHFFAQVSEAGFKSEIFGKHSKFSIMNYGELSKLTPADKSDLQRLYRFAWKGMLTEINGTPIRFVKPYSAQAGSKGVFAISPARPAAEPLPMAAYVGAE
jgi:hypothetical protein